MNNKVNVKPTKLSRALGSYLRPMYIKDAPRFRPVIGVINPNASSTSR